MLVFDVFILLLVVGLAAAPVVAATLLARKTGHRGGWLVWPGVAAVVFGLLMWLGYGATRGGLWPVVIAIMSGGYVGSVGLLVCLLVFGREARPDDDRDRSW